MHRSRLFGVFVDAPVDAAPGAAAFCAGAFGVPARATPGEVHSTPDVFAAGPRTWGA